MIDSVTRFWTHHELTLERGAALLALVGLAVAQPVLDVVSSSPEFFAARSTPPGVAVLSVLAVSFGLPLALLILERAIRSVSPAGAIGFLAAVLALLAAAAVLPWLKRGVAPGWPWDALAAGVAGAALAVAYFRVRPFRWFLTALGSAAIVVPVLFFLERGVRDGLQPAAPTSSAQRVGHTPPIVIAVFDELPLNALLDTERNIDAVRYPNFAALARDAYWFRNAGTVSAETIWALPAILTGRYPVLKHAVPTTRYYPDNLFTALAKHYDVFAFMRFRKLCPPGACRHDIGDPDDSVPALLTDLAVVWLHIVLPEPLAARLPPVVEDWAGFGEGPRAGRGGRPPNYRVAEFGRFLLSIDGRPGRLHFIHTLLPHMPFEYAPTGRRYAGPSYSGRREGGERLFLKASAEYADTLHQRHLAQVAHVDRLVGDLVDRLRQVGAYDSALVIVTADHGASYREGTSRRGPRSNNAWDIVHVPLFVKLPGQRHGEVIDRIVETVDILPTVLEVLAAEVPFEMDGHSLLDTRVPGRRTRTFTDRGRNTLVRRELDDMSDISRSSLERRIRRFGTGDPGALYSTPETRHLLGRPRSQVPARPEHDADITIRNLQQFEAVDLGGDRLPLYVHGVIAPARDRPETLAVVVNGRVAATMRSHREEDATVFGTLVPEDVLRAGRNTVEVVVLGEERAVDRVRAGTTRSAR